MALPSPAERRATPKSVTVGATALKNEKMPSDTLPIAVIAVRLTLSTR